MSALKAALAAQVGFFAVWGAQLLWAHNQAEVVLLETEPVDPRDWISGHYVQLRYTWPDCPRQRHVWVRLEPDGPYWKPRQCAAERGDGLWLKAATRSGRLTAGIERFYVGEDNPLREARSGQVAAKVSVNGHGNARILELVRNPAKP